MAGEIQEFITLTPWTIIFQICNLLILMLLLKKFLFKPVMRVLDARQKEIDDIYENANEVRVSAENLKEAYDKQLAGARGEADALVKNAVLTAQKRESEIVESAKEQAGHLRQKAQDDIERDRRKAFMEVKDQIADMAVDIAEKMVGREIRKEDHADVVEDFLKNVGDAQ